MKQLILYLLILFRLNLANAQTGPAIRLQPDAIATLPPGASLSALATGDFNHDGRRDLAVCERNLGQVALYMRSAAGTYPKAKFTYDVGQSPSGLVSFGRNRNVYSADLMALSGPSSQWTMLRDDQDTTGNLVRRVLTPGFGASVPSPRPVLTQADVDQDGTPDFAYIYPAYFGSYMAYDSYYNDTYIPIPHTYRQYSAAYFNRTANASMNLALADFDLNGFLDEVVADSTSNTVHIIANFQQELASIRSGARGPVHTSAQDIDNDMLADLAIAYAGSNEVVVLRTAPNFVFNRGYSYALPASPRRVLLADLNRDSYPELLVVTADNQLRVYQHDGSGSALSYATIPPVVLATGVNPSVLQVADLNNDSYPDIIVGCAGDNTVHTYLNRASTVTASRASQLLADIEVYPTLATDHVTIHAPTARPLEAALLDEVGRPVWQQQLTGTTNLVPTGDLPRGLYLLRLVGADGIRTTRLVLR